MSTGSGSHDPAYRSRCALAEVSRSGQRFVTTFASQAADRPIAPRSAPLHRGYASCTVSSASAASAASSASSASSASAAEPSIRYASPTMRGRWDSNSSAVAIGTLLPW
ncbi:hypothetical protein ACWGNN_25535 [Streptomyces sp. NPDC055817]